VNGSLDRGLAGPPPSPPPPKLFGPAQATRDDIARYLLQNRAAIRRRVLGKLRAAGEQGVDPDDVTSSVLHRVDLAMLRGILRTESEREFWAYVLTIADNLVRKRLMAGHDRGRAHSGSATVSSADPQSFAVRAGLTGNGDDAAERLHEVLKSLECDRERSLMLLKLRDLPNKEIAQALCLSESALRQRWSRICRKLRARFSPPTAS